MKKVLSESEISQAYSVLLGKGFQAKDCFQRVPISHQEKKKTKHWRKTMEMTREKHWTPRVIFSALFRHLYKLGCHLLMSNWEDEELLAKAVKDAASVSDYKGMRVLRRGSSTLPDHRLDIWFFNKHKLLFTQDLTTLQTENQVQKWCLGWRVFLFMNVSARVRNLTFKRLRCSAT